jgi:hypothetical protein
MPESLTQKPTWPDYWRPRTAFETHNGRSALAAATGLHAPLPTLRRVSELADDTEHGTSIMHYLDRVHRPSFGAIRSPKCAKQRQHSLGIDKAAESTMVRELSGAPDLGELIEPGSVFSAISRQFAAIHTARYRQQGD